MTLEALPLPPGTEAVIQVEVEGHVRLHLQRDFPEVLPNTDDTTDDTVGAARVRVFGLSVLGDPWSEPNFSLWNLSVLLFDHKWGQPTVQTTWKTVEQASFRIHHVSKLNKGQHRTFWAMLAMISLFQLKGNFSPIRTTRDVYIYIHMSFCCPNHNFGNKHCLIW